MAFLTKAEVDERAVKYGVDLSGLSWPRQQKAILDYEREHGLQKGHQGGTGKNYSLEETELAAEAMVNRVVMEEDNLAPMDWRDAPIPQKPVTIVPSTADAELDQDLRRFRNTMILVSPEIVPNAKRALLYDEELGDELILEEHSLKEEFEKGQNILDGYNDGRRSTTYRIKGKTGRKVVGQSMCPKREAQIAFRPAYDLFPVARYNSRYGYLWTHHRLPNVKSTLMQSGYYEQFKNRFFKDTVMEYCANLLIVDIQTTHAVFKEIEEIERKKRAGEKSTADQAEIIAAAVAKVLKEI